ncbi:hypothetical protein MC885_011004 [Smutsia gigantea]|nr:hypothetical protein MC885_011004 [Smutsia gigantea]
MRPDSGSLATSRCLPRLSLSLAADIIRLHGQLTKRCGCQQAPLRHAQQIPSYVCNSQQTKETERLAPADQHSSGGASEADAAESWVLRTAAMQGENRD